MTAIEWTEQTWSGRVASAPSWWMTGTPRVDALDGPEGRPADLDGLGEVRGPVGEVVDALGVDAETFGSLLGRQISGDVHGFTVSARSRSATAILRVGQLLERSDMTTTPDRVRATAASRLGLSLDEYDAKIAAGQKWCTKCKAWQSRSEFAKDRSRGDGLKSTCNGHYARKTPGPTKAERRQHELLGQRWCRGCKAWLPAADVNRSGACRPCAATEARAYYAGPAGDQIRALKYARKRSLDPIPPWWREEHFAAFGDQCAYGCGSPAEVIDHVWPVAQGGKSTPGNLVPACADCNGKKSDKNPTPWVERGLASMPRPWERLVALAMEHNTDNWLEEIVNG